MPMPPGFLFSPLSASPLTTLHQYNVVGKTARYSPNLGFDFVIANNPSCPTLPSQSFQRHAVAVFFHFGIIANAEGILDVNHVVI